MLIVTCMSQGLAMLLHITMLLLLIRNFQLTLEIYIPEILMCHNVRSSLTIITRKLHGNYYCNCFLAYVVLELKPICSK